MLNKESIGARSLRTAKLLLRESPALNRASTAEVAKAISQAKSLRDRQNASKLLSTTLPDSLDAMTSRWTDDIVNRSTGLGKVDKAIDLEQQLRVQGSRIRPVELNSRLDALKSYLRKITRDKSNPRGFDGAPGRKVLATDNTVRESILSQLKTSLRTKLKNISDNRIYDRSLKNLRKRVLSDSPEASDSLYDFSLFTKNAPQSISEAMRSSGRLTKNRLAELSRDFDNSAVENSVGSSSLLSPFPKHLAAGPSVDKVTNDATQLLRPTGNPVRLKSIVNDNPGGLFKAQDSAIPTANAGEPIWYSPNPRMQKARYMRVSENPRSQTDERQFLSVTNPAQAKLNGPLGPSTDHVATDTRGMSAEEARKLKIYGSHKRINDRYEQVGTMPSSIGQFVNTHAIYNRTANRSGLFRRLAVPDSILRPNLGSHPTSPANKSLPGVGLVPRTFDLNDLD